MHVMFLLTKKKTLIYSKHAEMGIHLYRYKTLGSVLQKEVHVSLELSTQIHK